MERKTGMQQHARIPGVVALASLTFAALWDVARAAGVRWTPVVSYVLVATALAAGCIALLLRILDRSSSRRRSLLQLVVLGVLLAAWMLRAHPEIPADPPIVAVQLLAALLLAAAMLHRGSPR